MPDPTTQDQERELPIHELASEIVDSFYDDPSRSYPRLQRAIVALVDEQRERDAKRVDQEADHPLEDCQVLVGVGEEARWEPSCELHRAAAAVRRSDANTD